MQPDKPLTCPRCQQPATIAHFKERPECAAAVKSLIGIYTLSKRKTVTRAGGRPVKLKTCPRCHQQVSTTEARYGHEGCASASVRQEPGTDVNQHDQG